jgi:DNA-binding SARP family transcriptional activator
MDDRNAYHSAVVAMRSSTTYGSQEGRRWPVCIYTLGRFEVLVRDKPLHFRWRVQIKPLELLRTLIVLGGHGVPIVKLAQELWPDKNVKAAKHALETTLYRLRKLLGDRGIDVKGGHLTLDADWCWLDSWQIEQLLDPAEAATSPVTKTRRLFELYRGPFLDGDDTPSVLIQRERLHSKFLRAVGQLGRTLQSQAHHEIAVECYQKGIEADPLAEELYRGLMQCFYELKRPAEALAVYWRCHKTLTCILGVEPTAETEALCREIQSDSVKKGRRAESDE